MREADFPLHRLPGGARARSQEDRSASIYQAILHRASARWWWLPMLYVVPRFARVYEDMAGTTLRSFAAAARLLSETRGPQTPRDRQRARSPMMRARPSWALRGTRCGWLNVQLWRQPAGGSRMKDEHRTSSQPVTAQPDDGGAAGIPARTGCVRGKMVHTEPAVSAHLLARAHRRAPDPGDAGARPVSAANGERRHRNPGSRFA